MAITPRESEIQKLGRFYRQAIRDMAKEFVANIDFATARNLVQIQSVIAILSELDQRTVRWARRNIERIYRMSSKEAQRRLRRAGLSRTRERIKAFSVINDGAIQALLNDPQTGFLSGIRTGIQQIKDRMTTIQNQARLLRVEQRLFDETIARVGFLQGRGMREIRDKLVDEMVSLKRNSELLFTSRARHLPPSHIVKNVADLPFVKIPTNTAAQGFRRLRIDKYAELLGRTKTGQAASLARRQKALEHDVQLVQITRNKPMHDDACYLYIGKVFALTQAAKAKWGVPHVDELPNGGAPFHPNCTHSELIFMPDLKSRHEVETSTRPPPAWALNRPWGDVQKEYQRRGGAKNIDELNPTAESLGRTTGGRERARGER